MQTYIKTLKALAAERNAATAAARAARSKPLQERIRDWYDSQTPDNRKTSYTMAELVREFRLAPGLIGPALHELGWKRGRSWRAGSPYGRFWQPPSRRDRSQ